MKNHRKNRRSPPYPGTRMMQIAAILFCLVLFSTHLTAGLYARYTSTGESTDAARVAGFDVDVTGPDGVEIVYSASDEGVYKVKITNNSEVAISYSIKVAVDQVDFGINVKLGETVLSTVDSTVVDFGTVGSLAAMSETEHDLIFSVMDWGEFTRFVEEAKREHTLNFTVYIDAVQID